MSKPSGHPSSIRKLALAWSLCLLPLFLGACADPVGEAEFQATRGELEQAEVTLGDATGKRATRLRTRIAALREERIRAEEQIQKLVALAADGEIKVARDQLRKFGSTLHDAHAKDAVDRARSQLSDLAAAEVTRRSLANARKSRGTTELPGEPEESVRAREVALVSSMLGRILDNVNRSIADKDWLRARSLIKMAVASAGDQAGTLEELLGVVESKGRADMESLLASARELQEERGPEAAYNYLAREASRFPESGSFGAFHARMSEIGHSINGSSLEVERVVAVAKPERIREPERVPTPKPTPLREPALPESLPSAGPDENATEYLVSAARLEEEDQLAAAREEWSRASEAFPRGRQRKQAAQHAENLDARLTLRREVAEAAEYRADYFSLLGVESITEEYFVIRGESVRWRDVEKEVFERAVLLTTLSTEARVGWIQELWVRGDEDAPHELAAALARNEVSEQQAWSIVADIRSEFVPDEGYAYESGQWVDRGAARREELASQLAAWGKKLATASTAKRGAHYAVLLERGADAREALESALQKRWTTAFTNLSRGATLTQLERLAVQRELLDGRRDEALRLIFDEEEYFYPYNPPECPPDKARLYPEVQQRVDALVGRVREVWDDSQTVSLPKRFCAAVDELDWNRQRQGELGLAFEVPEELPPWLAALDPETEKLTLHTFAWNTDERVAHEYDRMVLAFNEHNWETFVVEKGDELSEANTGEQEQVRITNAYRLLFGRRALAWNSRLQVAAQGHSDWMSRTGKFSHFNDEDKARTTPGDRMRLAGYNSGISENLHQGGSGPQGAHDGWARSSGHHRNLLMPGHREMASATSGQFWTQNFGTGRDFLEKLKAWYD